MPPGGAIDMDTIAVIRRWIDEGAKVDTMNMPAPGVPVNGSTGAHAGLLPAAANLPAPVTALAYSPDGGSLAVGGYRVVRLLNPTTGDVVSTIPGVVDQVQALAWSSDGKFLAAAGGAPGLVGEVIVFDTGTWKSVRKLEGHEEVVYSVAWKPKSSEIAIGSLDKTARIWDTSDGKCLRVIKDHADAVFSVVYSPDGKLLATGSGDRSAKLFDTASWKRVAALTAHQDAVTRVAFNANGTFLATAGTDKQVRLWEVKPGQMENPKRSLGEGDVINACVFSPDGNLLVWGASNKVVKVFNGDGTQQKNEMKEPEDWVYAVAVAADSRTIVAGTQDGKVLFWDVKTGKLLRTVVLLSSSAKSQPTTGTTGITGKLK